MATNRYQDARSTWNLVNSLLAHDEENEQLSEEIDCLKLRLDLLNLDGDQYRWAKVDSPTLLLYNEMCSLDSSYCASSRWFPFDRRVSICKTAGQGSTFLAIANEKLENGALVCADHPLLTVVAGHCQLLNCHHCARPLGTMTACYPCRQCANVLYCSGVCQHQSWVMYHQVECAHLALLTLTLTLKQRLAIRCLIAYNLVWKNNSDDTPFLLEEHLDWMMSAQSGGLDPFLENVLKQCESIGDMFALNPAGSLSRVLTFVHCKSMRLKCSGLALFPSISFLAIASHKICESKDNGNVCVQFQEGDGTPLVVARACGHIEKGQPLVYVCK